MARFFFSLVLLTGFAFAIGRADNANVGSSSANVAALTVPPPIPQPPGLPALAAPPANASPSFPAPPPPEYLDRYGKLFTSGSEPAHPLHLVLPFPEVGQVKIPSPEEISTRTSLEHLAILPDDQIRKQLAAWPAFAKMSFGDEGALLIRVQQLKDRRGKIAEAKARELGLTTLSPAQEQKFEAAFWDGRLKLDQDLAKQFGPIYQNRSLKLDEGLFRQFSIPPPRPIAQNQRPPLPNSAPPAIAR